MSTHNYGPPDHAPAYGLIILLSAPLLFVAVATIAVIWLLK